MSWILLLLDLFKNKNKNMANIISYFVFIFRLFKIRFFPPPEFSKQLADEILICDIQNNQGRPRKGLSAEAKGWGW